MSIDSYLASMEGGGEGGGWVRDAASKYSYLG